MATAEPWCTVMVKNLRQTADKASPSIPNTLALLYLCTETPRHTHVNPHVARPRVPPVQPADAVSTLPNSLLNQKLTKQTAEQEIQTANHPLPLPLLLFLEHLRVQHWLGN